MSKLILELLKVSRLKDEEEDIPKEPEQSEDDDLEGDLSLDGEDEMDPELDGEEQPEGDDQGEDDFSDFDDLIDDDGEEDAGGDEIPPEEGKGDPNRAGVIRRVKGAHLVYKREQDDGTYEELYIYNSGKFRHDMDTKKAILAGTDIPKNATQSPDGSQVADTWSAGNCTLIRITGIPQ